MNKITKSFFIVLVMFFSISASSIYLNDDGVKGFVALGEGVNGIYQSDEGVRG